jgi:release factor glutamine methyltransferase
VPVEATLKDRVVAVLREAGFPSPAYEAEILVAGSGGDADLLGERVRRRTTGEPLEWITGVAGFCGRRLYIEPGVYVPRGQTEPLAVRAAELLPERGVAVDIATGCGAVAATLAHRRPSARVVATDVDPVACRCARSNGVEAYQGHLAAPVPAPLWGRFNVVFAVVPYVPTGQMQYLPRDVRCYEPATALDGGKDGLGFLAELVVAGPWLLQPGGSMVLELGGDQDVHLYPIIEAQGFEVVQRFLDQDGDLRGLELRI